MNLTEKKHISRMPLLVWFCVVFLFLYVLAGIILVVLGVNIMTFKLFFGLYLALPILFLVVHSVVVLSVPRATLFLGFAFVLGYSVEWAGVKNGIIFGSRYAYGDTNFLFHGVPLVVPLYWAALSYTAYSVVNSFLQWKGRAKPSWKNKNIFLLLLLMLCDVAVICSIDILLDPIAVALGAWKWEHAGQFHGVPTGNFFGWILMAILIIGVYRIFEFVRPQTHTYKSSLLIIPVLGFGILNVLLFVEAVKLHLWLAVTVGGALTFSITLLSIIYFILWIKKKYPKEQLIGNGNSGYFRQLLKELLGS